MNTNNPKLVVVEYQGRQLPFLNNLAALRNLSADTGIATLSGLEQAIDAARQNPDNIEGLILLGKNFYYAFKEGHRVAKKEFDMELDDMLDTELTTAIADAINKKYWLAQ